MARLAKIIASKRKPKFAIRHRNRCELCGRARGYLSYFKLCRICFRTLALKGMIPGVTKASW
ncbi:MAG: type Z 30S ribosomal protein S14 [Oligoflexia bacterium]|nr:type Z 30S ribosomal protein S14 [Oligoflexia bacterium]